MSDAGRLLILADDFTGACDAAAAFATAHRTLVVVGTPAHWPAETEVLSVDLDLRERSNADARVLTGQTAPLMGSTRVFLKIDSTLRGPIGGLIAGALEFSGRQVAVIAPAFPEQGRLLREGRLVVDGQPGASLIGTLAVERTELLGATVVRTPEAVALAVEQACSRGARHVVVDADGPDCLHSVAAAWAPHAQDWLLVGSAGLARQVAGSASHPAPELASTASPVLIVAGSPAPVTQAQIERLRGHAPIIVVSLVSEVPERPAGDHAALVVCTPPAEARDSGERARAVADVVAAWSGHFRPGALVLAGGATGRVACERLGARGVRLYGELGPGIPHGYLHGGVWDDLRVVTKAGGFGTPDTLLDVMLALGVSSVGERTHAN